MPRPNVVLEPGNALVYKTIGKSNEAVVVRPEDAKKASFIKLFDVNGRTFAAFSIKGKLYAQPYRG